MNLAPPPHPHPPAPQKKKMSIARQSIKRMILNYAASIDLTDAFFGTYI